MNDVEDATAVCEAASVADLLEDVRRCDGSRCEAHSEERAGGSTSTDEAYSPWISMARVRDWRDALERGLLLTCEDCLAGAGNRDARPWQRPRRSVGGIRHENLTGFHGCWGGCPGGLTFAFRVLAARESVASEHERAQCSCLWPPQKRLAQRRASIKEKKIAASRTIDRRSGEAEE